MAKKYSPAAYQRAKAAKSGAGPKKQTLEEFLGERGLAFPVSDYMLDKTKIPHGLTARQRVKLENDAARAAEEYQQRRNAAIDEYHRLLEEGKIVDKTWLEIALERAGGREENNSTQAARRVLAKRGYNWKTGERASIPDGMSIETYNRLVGDGFGDSDIAKIHADSQVMRGLADTVYKGGRDVTSTTYDNAMRRNKDDVERWLGRR